MIKNSSRIVLNAFLANCKANERVALFQYLSPIERQVIEKLPKTYGNPLADNETEASLLRHIHPSWIAPFLRTLPEKEIGFFLASLEHSRGHAVGKELLYTSPLPKLTALGKTFLQKTLLGYLTAEIDDLLPRACLPDSPLNVLLELSDETLAISLDFLGLHDLSLEVRQIIEKQKLQAIFDALSPSQMSYLKILTQSQEPVAFTRLGLANWNGDQDKLRSLIRQRGGNRLAKALHGQDLSFIWHILHKLDVERALVVKKLLSPLDNSRAVQILINQIIEFINYTRKQHE
jgi:hypothetical protein